MSRPSFVSIRHIFRHWQELTWRGENGHYLAVHRKKEMHGASPTSPLVVSDHLGSLHVPLRDFRADAINVFQERKIVSSHETKVAFRAYLLAI